MECVKCAAVGCGGMGRRDLNGAAGLAKSSQYNFELAAVCDLNRENANYLADALHFERRLIAQAKSRTRCFCPEERA